MALSTLYFYMRAQAVSGSKFFEVLTMGITGIATLAYLLMFTGAGRMWVEEVPGTFSPVYWGRYVDWVLTTPLMLWDILALAGAPADEIAQVLIMDMLMIGFGCAGAQTPDHNKWSPPPWKRACTPSWMSLPSACSVSLSSKLVALLKPLTTATRTWMLKYINESSTFILREIYSNVSKHFDTRKKINLI